MKITHSMVDITQRFLKIEWLSSISRNQQIGYTADSQFLLLGGNVMCRGK